MTRQELEVQSQVKAVTVYRDRASVTRLFRGNVPAGVSYLIFSGLPGDLDEGTLRARARSSSTARLGSVEIKQRFLSKPAPEQEAKLAELIQQMTDEIAGMDAQRGVLLERRDFLQGMEQESREYMPQSLARRILDSEGARDIWGKLFDDLLATTLHIQTTEVEIRERKKDLVVLQKELNRIRSNQPQSVEVVEVMIEMEKEAEVEAELEYTVWGATWEPIYDIRLDSEKSLIKLEIGALVNQTTGEDWLDSELRLSTASPELSLNPPETSPIYLGLYVPAPPMAYMASGMAAPSPAPEKAKRRAVSEECEEYDSQDAVKCSILAEPEAAVVESRGASVTYVIPFHADVPCDGQSHRVFVAERELAAKLDHLTRPMHTPRAYLRAVVVNEGDYFLPNGRSNLYRDGEFAGSGTLGPVRAGEEFKLSLGVDERLEIKLIPRPLADEKAGLLGKTAKQNRSYKLEAKSHLTFATKLTVEWEMPLTTNDDLKVKINKVLPKPESQKDDGVAKFVLDVPAGGSAEMQVEWEVEYPRDRTLTGMPD